MAEQHVITSMLDDLSQQQPISTAICIGKNWAEYPSVAAIQWQHFSVSDFLKQPFTQRYDLGAVILNRDELAELPTAQRAQLLVKLRDLFAKRILVIASDSDTGLLRALGFSQLLESDADAQQLAIWQFNILSYKQVPDWLNAKYWANPDNWNKFRW